MNYKKIYKLIVKNGKKRGLVKSALDGYYEKHHIKPKCMGGDDRNSNLVLLKPKEHFICHHILYKIHKEVPKLLYAYKMMTISDRYDHRLTDKEYDVVGKLFSKMVSESQIKWIKDHPDEWKDRMNKINKNPDKIRKMADTHRGMKRSEASKKLMSKSALGKRKGKFNGVWNGYYITPNGTFESVDDACAANKIRSCSLHSRCKYRNSEKINFHSLRVEDVFKEHIGKTWKQLGWGFKKV